LSPPSIAGSKRWSQSTSLSDETPTGGVYTVEDVSIIKKYDKGGYSSGSLPRFLANPGNRLEKVEETRYSIAAEKISSLVFGAPHYHPLLKNAGPQLAKLKSTVNQFGGNLRLLSSNERQALLDRSGEPFFIPDIRPLGRAATAADVKAGKAI